jgi:hypothetical protein
LAEILPRKERGKANIDGAGPSSWTGSDANQAANLSRIQFAHNERERSRNRKRRENETQAKRKKRLNGESQRIAKKRSTEKREMVKRDGMLALTLIPVSGSRKN